jgi:Response regulator containing a CheY-like receiver domain and an HTH DNA-binding domain
MTANEVNRRITTIANDRRLSVIVFSLFFAWLLAFPFEGQILYTLTDAYHIEPHSMVFSAIAATFSGLFSGGFLANTIKRAKKMILGSAVFDILASAVFFSPPGALWLPALVLCSYSGGCAVAAWGFYFRGCTPKGERIKTAADGLAYSNILMILLNMAAIHLSPRMGLGLSILVLAAALLFAYWLPVDTETDFSETASAPQKNVSIAKPLAFLCLFVVVITINSGLMYQVQAPAFSQLSWLTSWYWAVPYIVALFIMRNLSRKVNRTYILYVAIAMIGFSFIFFLLLDRSALSYFVVNTLMLGACGVYDLFWWSILGEMLDYDRNAAKVLGIGLSANVLGVLLGGLIGHMLTVSGLPGEDATLLALGVVCVTLVILPPLHKHLSVLLSDHAYLTMLSDISPQEQTGLLRNISLMEKLTEREREIAALLLMGKTYRMIAGELFVSENTVRTHIKNIYSKLEVQSRAELTHLMLDIQTQNDNE